MTIDLALTYLVEILFAGIFLRAVLSWWARRDPLSRDIALTFSPFVGLLATTLSVQILGAAFPPLSLIAGVLFVLQPVFALHLVSLIRPVPRAVIPVTLGILAVGIAIAFLVRPTPPVVGIVLVATFIGAEGLAAAYLLIEARRRRGPGGRRLGLAAISTGLFAAALIASGTAAIGPAVADAAKASTIGLALVAGLGYTIAFMPPAFMRNLWQADATVAYQHDLLARSGEPLEAIWDGFARFASEVTGAVAVVVEDTSDRASTVLASAGMDQALGLDTLSGRLPAKGRDLDLTDVVDPTVADLGAAVGARFVSLVGLAGPGDGRAPTLAILSGHRSLFHETDLDLLATIGAQTAIVAERRATLAEQEALASRLSMTVEALRAASQAKSDFLASMSHELRTPLSAILGFSDLMRQGATEGEDVSVPLEWVDHIHRGGQHLLALVNDVLDLAKVEAGRMELQKESLDLRQAISEAIGGIQPLADRKELGLVATVEDTPLVADRGRIRQVLYNLLSNAIKFTPAGGEVRVEGSSDRTGVRIAVIDNGVGIAREDLPSVFDEFRQVGDQSDRSAGTGLGLALTRRLVEAHGGRIEVTSTVGEGSCFTIFLPDVALAQPAEGEAPGVVAGQIHRALDAGPTTAGIAARRPVAPGAALDVLLVEDDPSAVRLLREYLEPAGYRVHVASDGESGLAMARELMPAAIVLDVLLPGMDGWEVLRRIKADVAIRDVPVVFATVVDEREVGLALGAADYLVKPITRDNLLAALVRLAPGYPAEGATVRVLAVDDEPTALAFLEAALSAPGYEVITSTDGGDAIALAVDGAVDVVICDLMMPEIDGFEVVSRLKADPRTRDIPIIVCTAHDLSERDRERLSGNILGVVAKGDDARDGLRSWLERSIQIRREGAA